MPREKEGFREQLARLDELFPGKEVLSMNEVCAMLRTDRRTILRDKTFPAKKIGGTGGKEFDGRYAVPKVGLARWMA